MKLFTLILIGVFAYLFTGYLELIVAIPVTYLAFVDKKSFTRDFKGSRRVVSRRRTHGFSKIVL